MSTLTVATRDIPRYAPERQQAILEQAREAGRVEVGALAEALGVTPETVRRDLTALERLGKVRRVHGGALPVDRLELEPTLATRSTQLTGEKHRIAARALEELPAEGTILLDSGTTTHAIATLLPRDTRLTVVTNSPAIAHLVSELPDAELYMLGGRVRPRTGAAVGPWLEQALRDTCVDIAFLGTNGFSIERGMTTPNQDEAAAKATMLRAARRAVVVADSSKAGQEHFHRFARIDEIALLVTDRGLDDETTAALEDGGTDVVRV
ncbi:MAG TPA: DeoR/GlpR family DNA-binding transcription regulator [Dermatophilaceae bacterium]|nr:DeoR/GlpR family DNA-binding transcription regulator [Dermatophilaceae bacterium]